jgi:hypothetical protein
MVRDPKAQQQIYSSSCLTRPIPAIQSLIQKSAIFPCQKFKFSHGPSDTYFETLRKLMERFNQIFNIHKKEVSKKSNQQTVNRKTTHIKGCVKRKP